MKKQFFYRRIWDYESEDKKWDRIQGYLVTFPDIPAKFFVYKNPQKHCWSVNEITTGLFVCTGETRKKATVFAYKRLLLNLKILRSKISYWVEKNGLPPYPVE